MEEAGELDKRHKVKKKILQDTLAKVLELEKLKGDDLKEEDLLSIPNYIDFTQGPVILSDKPKETKSTTTAVPRPTLNINYAPNAGLPAPPNGPAPFDLPPPPDEPLPDNRDQPPLPQEDFQPPLPDGPAPQPYGYPYGNFYNPNINNVNQQWGNRVPNVPMYMPPNQINSNQQITNKIIPTPITNIQINTQKVVSISQQPVLINDLTSNSDKKFIGVPSALRVKRGQATILSTKKKARVDTVAAAIATSRTPVPQPQPHTQQPDVEEDFEKYMSEIAALGVL